MVKTDKMKKKILFYSQSDIRIPLNNETCEKHRQLSEIFDLFFFSQTERLYKIDFTLNARYLLFRRFQNFFIRHIYFLIVSIYFLPDIIRKNKIKNIVFQSGYDFPVIFFIKMLFRKKINIILEYHGDMLNGLKYYSSFFLKDIAAFFFVKFSEFFCDRKRAVSENLCKSADLIFPPWMDLKYYAVPMNIERKRQILFAGELNRIKNVDFLIRNLSEFLIQDNGYVLKICGDGRERKNLEDLSEKYGISDKVIFSGKLDRESLKYEYFSSELFILPSISEGFGRTACEAAVCGCKVLISENCGVKTFFDNENIFSECDFDIKFKALINEKEMKRNEKINSLIGNRQFIDGMDKLTVK